VSHWRERANKYDISNYICQTNKNKSIIIVQAYSCVGARLHNMVLTCKFFIETFNYLHAMHKLINKLLTAINPQFHNIHSNHFSSNNIGIFLFIIIFLRLFKRYKLVNENLIMIIEWNICNVNFKRCNLHDI